MLVGFAGKHHSGKTTAAAFLIDQGGRSYSLANPLKMLIGQCYQLSYEQLYGHLKDTVDERYGKTPRQLFQEIGTDVLRLYDPDIWIHCLKKFAGADMLTVIDDIRFPNEVQAIKWAGGLTFYVERADLVSTDEHVSENAVTAEECGHIVTNNSTPERLKEQVLGAMKLWK